MDDEAGTQPDSGSGLTNGAKVGRHPAAARPAPETVGSALQEARERAGLSLEDVSTKTKVRPGILRAIESDRHEELPALTYTLGFVKAYARTIGLDPGETAERYRRESQKGEPVPSLIALEPLDAGRTPSRRLVLVSTTALVLALGLFWAWGAGWLSPPPPERPQAVEPEAVAGPDTIDPDGTALDPAVDPAANPALVARLPVRLVAKDEVWLRIADGSELFFMGTLSAGQTLDLPAGKAWTLRTGRAGALELQVGGKPVAPLGGLAEQVRDLPLDPVNLMARGAADAGGLPATLPLSPPA